MLGRTRRAACEVRPPAATPGPWRRARGHGAPRSPMGWAMGAFAAAAAGEAVRDLPGPDPFQPEHVLVLLCTRVSAAPAAPPRRSRPIDGGRREIRYAGVGNISAADPDPGQLPQSRLAQRHLGLQLRKTQEFVYPWPPGALLVAHSDGLATHWKLEQYPGLFRQDPALVAAMLYRDHARPPRRHQRRGLPSHGVRLMNTPLLRIRCERGEDVVLARRATRQLAAHLGLDPQEQIRLATAVSEVCRNAVEYAGGGAGRARARHGGESALIVRVVDRGPGIPHLQSVLGGTYRSTSGLGVGLLGARRLSDRFRIEARRGRAPSWSSASCCPRVAVRPPSPPGGAGAKRSPPSARTTR